MQVAVCRARGGNAAGRAAQALAPDGPASGWRPTAAAWRPTNAAAGAAVRPRQDRSRARAHQCSSRRNGKLIQQSEAKLGGIESKLGELDAQERQLRGSLGERHGAISALLAALQRMGRNPPPVMITRREDALTMVRSAMLWPPPFPSSGARR
jgi:hypothetical protein